MTDPSLSHSNAQQYGTKRYGAIVASLTLLLLGSWTLAANFSEPAPPQTSPLATPAESNNTRFTDIPNVPQGLFRYGGSTTWAPIRRTVDFELQRLLPDFRLNYVHPDGDRTPSSVAGVEMLADGKLDFVQTSRLLNASQLNDLQHQGIRLKAIPVAKSFKVIAVHPALQLSQGGLTTSQIEDICTAKITNWKTVGGPDLPIQLVDRITKTPTLSARSSLGDDCYSPTLRVVATPQQAMGIVAETPGAFYVNTAALLVPQCSLKVLPIITLARQQLSPVVTGGESSRCPELRPRINLEMFRSGQYPRELSDILYVMVQEEGGSAQAAGETYAALLKSDEGRSLLEKTGFLGLD